MRGQNETLTGRTWGDGGSRSSAHTIHDISIEAGSITCACEASVVRATGLTLEDAWDIHRGKASLVTERMLNPETPDRASDAEVDAFLTLASDPSYEYEAEA